MLSHTSWWPVGIGLLFVVLLWRRQVALCVVLVCASYGAAQHGLVDLRPPTMPAHVKDDIAERQARGRERARRYACERRAVAALSRDDEGVTLARVHADCRDVFTADPASRAE